MLILKRECQSGSSLQEQVKRMVRRFKLFGHQYFGFWAPELVCFAVQYSIVFLVVHFMHVYGNLMGEAKSGSGAQQKKGAN